MPATKYPDVRVRLTDDRDGNALAVVGTVSRALREARVPRQEVGAFQTEALSGDYDKVLRTVVAWVTVV